MKNNGKEPIRVGVAGLGRSGWGIHIRTLRHISDRFKVVAVLDDLEDRRNQASTELGCNTYSKYEDLLADDSVELVVVAMPTAMHVPWSLAAMEAGKDVVVEKPMASDLAECDQLIETEKKTGRAVTVFQNRRYVPAFLKMREVIESGVLGRVNFMRVMSAGYGRRWDWQTVKDMGGGALRNNGIHNLDALMEFSGASDPEIFCKMDRLLCAGDAEDWLQLILKAEDAPTMEIDIFCNCTYPQGEWLVLGQKGSMIGSDAELKWKVVKDFDSLPELKLDLNPTEGRSYNREKLEFEESVWTAPEDCGPNEPDPVVEGFYGDVYAHLRDGAPQAITTASVRRRMAVIDHCLKNCWV